MKKLFSVFITISMLFSMLSVTAASEGEENVNPKSNGVEISEETFPDDNFRTYVSNEFDSDDDGVLSKDELNAVTDIYAYDENIASLAGIEYFGNLTCLVCDSNRLTELDVSKNTALTDLECGNNQLTKLNISGNAALEYLYCAVNQLTELDLSQNTALAELECYGNSLTHLNLSQNKDLYYFNCDGSLGQTRSISITPDTRSFDLSAFGTDFDASKLSIISGGTLSGSILSFDKDSNSVVYTYDTGLTDAPLYVTLNALGHVCDFGSSDICACGAVEISEKTFPDENFRVHVSGEVIDTDGNAILSKNEREAVASIDVYEKSIASLEGIEFFTGLTHLDCSDNQLSELELSNNPALENLYCGDNQLTALDVSNNAALINLDCGRNRLTSLDVSRNAALTQLWCFGNQLTSFDVSGNTALTYLSAANNMLELEFPNWKLDLTTLPGDFDITKASDWSSGNLEGTVLTVPEGTTHVTYSYDCGMGKMQSFTLLVFYPDVLINVENFPDAVFRDYVSSNLDKDGDGSLSNAERVAVTAIDVSGMGIADLTGIEHFTELTDLYCDSNRLTGLELSKNTELLNLTCGSNQLTRLNISNSTALESLACDNNLLTKLDVGSCAALKELYCNNNELTSLALPNSTALTILDCSWNALTDLDVSRCNALKELYCNRNQLTSLNISRCMALTGLYCSSNQLTSLNVADSPALTGLDCRSNQLDELDISNNPALVHLECDSNKLTELDLSKNTELISLSVKNNNLTHLDLSAYSFNANEYSNFIAGAQTAVVSLGLNTRSIDLSTLGAAFDVSKVSVTSGGTLNGNILSFDANSSSVQYTYDTSFEGTKLEVVLTARSIPVIGFAPNQNVEINGVSYTADAEGTLHLPGKGDFITASYSTGMSTAEDPNGVAEHQNYPTGMDVSVFRYKEADGTYTAEKIDALTNIMTYKGTSIRMTGNQGIRIFTAISEAKRAGLIDGSLLKGTALEGYKLTEYGTLFKMKTNGSELVYDPELNNRSVAYGGGKDSVFARQNGEIWFTGMLTNLQLDLCDDELLLRPYMVLENSEGKQFVIYGGTLQRNVGYVAYQNKDYKPTQAASDFIWNIINAVYGDKVKK